LVCLPCSHAAIGDVDAREVRRSGSYYRLDLWYQWVWKLQGLWLDPDSRVLRHKGNEAVLTNREFDLPQFLLDHPHRFYTSSQIMGYAWSDSALFPEEVRNYVSRVRKILVRLEIPCDLVNRPGRGYSLTFRNKDQFQGHRAGCNARLEACSKVWSFDSPWSYRLP